jgi:predicted membrane-bound mannosyltransferase
VLVATVPLYTNGFAHIDGAGGAFWSSLDYWLDQQQVQRGTQPGFYYFMMVPLYEFVALIPAAAGLWLLRRGDRLTALLAWWFAGTFLALSLAGEKMPWLTVHLALPLILLAARSIDAAAPSIWRGVRGQYGFFAATGAAVALVVGALLLGGSLKTATAVAFGHPDTPVEPLIYTQTSPDVPLLMAQITALRSETPEPLTVTVDTSSSFSWPWAWYLRDYPIVLYAGAETIAEDIPSDGILIATDSTLRDNPKIWAEFARAEPYRHRWWFPESGYRSLTPGVLFSGIREGSLLNDWQQFYIDRIEQSEIGSIDGVVLFPRAVTP